MATISLTLNAFLSDPQVKTFADVINNPASVRLANPAKTPAPQPDNRSKGTPEAE